MAQQNTTSGRICAEEYTVKRGDSFYLIAHKLGVPLRDLLAANSSIHPARLMVGDVLCVPREEDDSNGGLGSGSVTGGITGGSAGASTGSTSGSTGISGTSSGGMSSGITGGAVGGATIGSIGNTGTASGGTVGGASGSSGSTDSSGTASDGTSSGTTGGSIGNSGTASGGTTGSVTSGNVGNSGTSSDGTTCNTPLCVPDGTNDPNDNNYIPPCPLDDRLIVQRGQTVADIQLRNLVSRNTLEKANPNINLDALRMGQTICVPKENIACDIPTTYTLGVAENLEAVAVQFNLPISSILRANPCLAPQDFETGVTVVIPR